MPLTDAAVPELTAAAGGDSGAATLAAVLADYGSSLARIARIYAPNPADREDLLQEIAVALLRALPRFRGDSRLGTFVYRIALNRAISRRARAAPQSTALDAIAEPRDPAPGPEEQQLAAERRERLVVAVRRLPASLAEVVTLSLEGLSHGEIGEVLGISENNVAVRALRARALLRDWLEDVT